MRRHEPRPDGYKDGTKGLYRFGVQRVCVCRRVIVWCRAPRAEWFGYWRHLPRGQQAEA